MQIADWHKRYLEQARWTATLRHFLISKIPFQTDCSVLELGCGTGAILRDFSDISKAVVGLDLDLDVLTFQRETGALLVNGDACHPPFRHHSFNLVYCHYFLLWIADPVNAIKLAKTLLKPGGYLAIFAEPDYASRQTAPESLLKLADFQNRSLEAQGACLKTGRNLGKLLIENGFSILESETYKQTVGTALSFSESEKLVLRSDWECLNRVGKVEITKEELEELLTLTPERWNIPTYYALAQVKA